MLYSEALEAVRKSYPLWLIRTGWIYNECYHFSLSLKNSHGIKEPPLLIVFVDNDGKLGFYGTSDGPKLSYEDFCKAAFNDFPVDLTEKQYAELVASQKLFRTRFQGST